MTLPWTDYDDSSYCDLYDLTGTYITYFLATKYVVQYPSHWSWSVCQRSYDWAGTAFDTELRQGCEFDRRSAKKESERWFRENVSSDIVGT